MAPSESIKIKAEKLIGKTKSTEGGNEKAISSFYKEAELRRFEHVTDNIKWLSKWAASLVSIWLLLVFVLLLFNKSLHLSDPVLITLLGTTTLNVIGIPAIVLRGHFSSSTIK